MNEGNAPVRISSSSCSSSAAAASSVLRAAGALSSEQAGESALWPGMESGSSPVASGGRGGGGGGRGGWEVVEARLQGGAPWGFTLQGGLEHGEPLIISKVEEGGKADCSERRLLVGDELVIINDMELSGFRQEAIALVKGSYKTLQLTVRRKYNPEFIEEFDASPPSFAAPPPPPLPPPSPPSDGSGACSEGGVHLRTRSRRSEPAARPHSWHSTKLGEAQQDGGLTERSEGGTASTGGAWLHHAYHTSVSTTDLSAGFESGYLRKSPDQYSSRGSMESLDPPQSSQHHPGAPHHQHQHHHQHPLGQHPHSSLHPAYSSCHQLSSARSSNSIDHLHSKRDSAYSSFSTSSSIPEYLASAPPFSPERSYSLEMVPQRGAGSGDMQQADVRYVRTVYDNQQGFSREFELGSTSVAPLHGEPLSGGGARAGLNRDPQGSVGGVCYRGSISGSSSSGGCSGGVPASNRHSVGPIWGQAASRSSYESLRGAPAPPQRSDSYAAIRNHERHERPNSWSSLEHPSLRSLHKGSWHHSSGSVASAKGSFSAEGQLHTVMEKSPESSPTTKPRQGGGVPQPGSSAPQQPRLILPAGVYQVPPPEPHYAQIPSSAPSPGPTGVYPALAKERDGRTPAVENGHQNNPSSSSSSSASAAQLRNQPPELHRPQQEDANFGLYRPQMKSMGGGAGSQTGTQRPQTHPGSHSQSFPEPGNQVLHTNQVFQEQNQDFQILQPQVPPHGFRSPASQSTSQEQRDSFRTSDQSRLHPEPAPKIAQGQVPPTPPVHPQHQAPPTPAPQPSSHPHGDSAASQHQQWDHKDRDRDNPLTRLEIALAEVQQCASPDVVVSSRSSQSNSNYDDGHHGPTRSLSVLEKVSRFERRERAGKQRSHSTSHANSKLNEKGWSAPCGPEDLRNMLERSTNAAKAHRTVSYRGGSIALAHHRVAADPSSALQRSRSTVQLDFQPREGDRDLLWRQDLQDLLGSIQDTSFNRTYRESLKCAQSKVLHSTSFQRRDLSSVSAAPPPAPPPPSVSSGTNQEKKGPKTMPKPQGVILAPSLVASPHTPKERHVVSPDTRGPSPPALPSVPPVGPPPVTRICGRKRLTMDQKKRSYSEPDSINEVGVSDAETAALFRRGGETSIADRRRMFETAASRVGGGAQNATSRPELRQLQQDAVAEYMERKRGMKRDEGGRGRTQRPHSVYIQAEKNNHTDVFSLSSASSLLSLQDSGPDRSFVSGDWRLSSTPSPGGDLRRLQPSPSYPGRVTSQRLPPNQPSSSPPDRRPQDPHPESSLHKPGDPDLNQQPLLLAPGPQQSLSQQLDGALQRAGSGRSSGRSASAEDLLERRTPPPPQHHRSRSSPTDERLSQDVPPDDVRMFGVFISEPGGCSLAADRPADRQVLEGPVCPQVSHVSLNAVQPAQSAEGSSHTPVSRRERQRNGDRQRAHSASTLAASVGLPCPFSPPGAAGSAEWHASERLSQANLDAITFPGVSQTSTGDGARDGQGGFDVETQEEDGGVERHVRHSLSDAGVSGNTAKCEGRERASSLSTPSPLTHVQPAAAAHGKDSGSTPPSPPPPSSHPSVHRQLSSLRISESSLCSPQHLESSTGVSQEDFNEVFLQNPAPPSPPPPIRETDITQLPLPPPPPPHELEQEAGQQTEESSQILNSSTLPSSSLIPPPTSTLSTSTEPQPSTSITSSITTITSSTSSAAPTPREVEDSLDLEYQRLPLREKTCEEVQVEELARQLVLRDCSLAPLLATRGGKTTVELMEDVFSRTGAVGKSSWQRRGSSQLDGGIQDGDSADGGTETDLDEDDKDLTSRKVELCEALRQSVAALRREKEALSEEQRRHRALGASVHALVQERCKANERDKYNVFIGDLEKIVNLLLSLCSRLSRIDRSLLALDGDDLTEEDAEERDSLHRKRSQLLSQTEDARELKENLDRRQRAVHAILSGYLTQPQLSDYRRFVSTKPSLLIRQRRLDDLVRRAEEQLAQLAESLPVEQGEAGVWSKPSPFLSPSPAPCPSAFPSLLSATVSPGSAHAEPRSTTVTSL